MCLANVYKNGNMDESLLTEVAYLKLDDNQIEVETLLGESKVFRGKIKEIAFLNSKIVMEEMAE
jgi:predicted RNA-binding protein